MRQQTHNLRLGHIDVSGLETDDDFRREAHRLLPAALTQIGEAAGGTAWDELQRGLKSIPGMKLSGGGSRREAVRKAGQKYRQTANATTRRKVEDYIVKILKGQKARMRPSDEQPQPEDDCPSVGQQD